MKKQIIKVLLILGILSNINLSANSNNAVAGALIVGVLSAISEANSYDEIIDYKSYKINKEYKITVTLRYGNNPMHTPTTTLWSKWRGW